MSMPILPSTPVIVGIAALTVGALAGTVYGLATGGPVIPAVTIGLYAVGTLRLLAQRAISIPIFRPDDNVGNHAIRIFAPITLPIIGTARALTLLARGIEAAPVMTVLGAVTVAAVTALCLNGYVLVHVFASYGIGVAFLAYAKVADRRVTGMHVMAFALSPLTMPLLVAIGLEELVKGLRPPKPAVTDPAKSADRPPQDG